MNMAFIDGSTARQLEMCHAWRGIHYVRAKAQLHPESGVRIEIACGGQAIYAGPDSPLNRVIGLGFERPVTLSDMECIEAFYESKKAIPRIDVCPLADRSIIDVFTQSNYDIEAFQNVLIHPLDDSLAFFQPPKNIDIRQATPEDASQWILTTAQGFEGVEEPSQETLDVLAPNFYSDAGYCLFAFLEGKPAGGGGMYIHEGIAELGGASTRHPYRRRGIQTTLLQARMKLAREMNCYLVMVLTDPGSNSQRNLERIGFQLAYTKLIMIKRTRKVADF
jgi:GNAT superfamily N-acetyltransferase